MFKVFKVIHIAGAAIREHVFGAVNILLALAAIALGTAKPRLHQGQF